jgi:methylase of polypeptide subunit release factors
LRQCSSMEQTKRSALLPHGKKILSPENLARDFGPSAEISKRCIAKLYYILRVDHPACENWKHHFGRIIGKDFHRPDKALQSYAKKMSIDCISFDRDVFLFSLQTFYALLLELLVKQFPTLEKVDISEEPFSWKHWADAAAFAVELKDLSSVIAEYHPSRIGYDVLASGDLLKALYQQLFPRPLRHGLGEYYTPDWLAGHMLDQVGYNGKSNHRLLDPSCGSGTFLMSAVQRIRAAWQASGLNDLAESSNAKLCNFILSHIAGIDLNPLAVMTARANFLIAIHELLPLSEPLEIPIYLGDSILDVPPHAALYGEQFDIVVGNPPWIAWDNLPTDYREASKPLWEHYGLFSLSGNDARHGGGKKDLSMLMLYAVADRYLKSGGHLGFVITQTLFQTKGAGDGFRRFRIGSEGEWLKVKRVDDLVAVRPFEDAANWTSTIVIEKGRPTQYPVPYFKWHTNKDNDHPAKRLPTPFSARPIDGDKSGSPWLLQPEGFSLQMVNLVGPSDYCAHLGANTGGANGIYWLELLGITDGGVRVRNIPKKSKLDVEMVEAVIEPDLLYPFLRWRDITRYRAKLGHYLLLTQNCITRTGIDETLMREKYPLTLTYLQRFKQGLERRAAYRRYQDGRPFYSMYNIGPYTIAPIKVIWRRMDRRINAVVATTVDDPLLGSRPLIPQETCVLIACDSLAEAHYLCALLNSSLVNHVVQSHSVDGGKSFGTPSMLSYLNLRRFDPINSLHIELSKCSQAAHQESCPDIERQTNCLVAKLFGVK